MSMATSKTIANFHRVLARHINIQQEILQWIYIIRS
jgi:hypothetical protein